MRRFMPQLERLPFTVVHGDVDPWETESRARQAVNVWIAPTRNLHGKAAQMANWVINIGHWVTVRQVALAFGKQNGPLGLVRLKLEKAAAAGAVEKWVIGWSLVKYGRPGLERRT